MRIYTYKKNLARNRFFKSMTSKKAERENLISPHCIRTQKQFFCLKWAGCWSHISVFVNHWYPLRNRRSEVGGVGSPIFYSRPPLTIRASMLHNTISRPPQGLENRNMTIVSSTNVYWQIKDKYIEGLQAAFNDFEFHKNNVFFQNHQRELILISFSWSFPDLVAGGAGALVLWCALRRPQSDLTDIAILEEVLRS